MSASLAMRGYGKTGLLPCQAEGCPRRFRPRSPTQKYCQACARKVVAMRQAEERKRQREIDQAAKESNKVRREKLRAKGYSDCAIQNILEEYSWRLHRDPDYYTGVRHQGYSSLVSFVMPPGPARARGKSATTNRERK